MKRRPAIFVFLLFVEAVFVELSNEAGKVAVFEVVGQYLLCYATLLLCERRSRSVKVLVEVRPGSGEGKGAGR